MNYAARLSRARPETSPAVKPIKLVLLLAMFAAIGAGGWLWWRHESLYPSTDDAYVQSDIVTIAALVGGSVESVAVAENDHVQAGDTLFALDPASYRAALDAAEARLESARQGAGAGSANVASAEAALARATAALGIAETELARDTAMLPDGAVSRSVVDAARATREEAAADRDAAEAALEAARATLGAGGEDNAEVRAARAALASAALDLERTTLRAPASGWIANLSLRPGSVVAADEPLFSIVEDGRWWIEANFKETDLERIRPDMPATVSLDMYPDVALEGMVESIGAGSGAVFSLLPPENASGNWVKVTQRFTARILLTTLPEEASTPLRVGASTTVIVDTTGLEGS